MAVNGLDLINSNGMDDGYSTTITTGIPAAAVAAAVASAVTATVANNNGNLQGLYPRNVKVEDEGGEEDEDEDEEEEEEEEEGETAAQKGKDVINNGIGGNINNNSENIVQNSDEALHPAEHAYINCPPVGEGFSITADYSLPQAAAAHPFTMTQVPAMNRMQRRVPNTALNRNANFIQQQQQYNYYNYIQLQQQQQQQYHTHHHAHIHTHNNIHIQQNSQRPQSLPPITPSNSSQQFPVWNQQYFSLSNIQSQQQQQNNGSTNIFSVNSQQQQQQDNIYRLNNASQQQNTFNQGQQQQQQQQIPQMQYSSCTFSSPTQAYCQPPPGYDNDNDNGDFTRENGTGGICDNGIDQEDNCNTFYDDSYSSPQTSWYEKDSSVTIPTNVI